MAVVVPYGAFGALLKESNDELMRLLTEVVGKFQKLKAQDIN